MANVLINEDTMTDIADAIRAKKGVTTTYKPRDMAEAISSISGGGGITPTGTINITQNGTVDVTNYASANVAVPTGGDEPTGTKQISITANGTTTEDVTDYASAEITVNVPSGLVPVEYTIATDYSESGTTANNLNNLLKSAVGGHYPFFATTQNIDTSDTTVDRFVYFIASASNTQQWRAYRKGATSQSQAQGSATFYIPLGMKFNVYTGWY